ncbi:phospholipid-translocating P-type ATPase [Naegleria gruberi]|uniref:Phospholipid-transporting ATPase n=1 Tax=Naegleria gruberi TaxID=5762 RepID=D2V089_NAEGR|nr:phospholipid-translocating P-type ATPase [Naegleria gruberi]EFC49675.1 phospholipid-translocating P-type ATPase [Naegleria gruberi]|eukprot:XP_002682419.1 phospholipid-translocating P-type ATPase [Naegleria gruberi strain NEG-M]
MNTNGGGTILSRTSVAASKGGWKSSNNDDDENSYPSTLTSSTINNSKTLEDDRDDGKDRSSTMKEVSSPSSSLSGGEIAYYQEEEISNNGDESNINYSDDYEQIQPSSVLVMEEFDSEQKGKRRIIYGNVESHCFEREQLIHEHYHDQELTEAIQIRKEFSRERNFNYPRYSDNTISNTKYRWYNFLWKSISAQFSLRMNQYFLALACLQFWKAASPTNPIYQKDSEINSKLVTIIRHGKTETIPSYQLQAGDIVYLQDDEQIRADMVLIHSSNVLKKEGFSTVTGGIAWVETSALDGESHYKEKKSIGAIQKLLTTSSGESEVSMVNDFSCIIECNAPNADLDHFKGEIIVPYKNRMDRFSVTSNNLLLQGTTLKSTASALAVVIYTGNETKIGMNRKEVEMKWTKMDNFINHVVVGIFIVQFSIGLAFGLIGNYLYFNNGKNMFYLNTAVDFQHSKLVTGYYILDVLEYFAEKILPYLIIPLRFTMLCSLMIPQSLKITSDVAKYIISMFFIPKDDLLCDAQGNRTSASNTSVAEDLGQIDYIFSDKTGTLTENLLTLSRVIVDGKVVDASVSHHPTSINTHKIGFLNEQCNFTESTLSFLRNLALCHTVYCDNSTSGSFLPHYRSSSPEEDAFVKYAAYQGVVLNYRDEERMILRIHSDANNFTLEEYNILKVIHFTSDRRRMSIIVKRISDDPNQCKYYIFCKGADDVICERMNNQANAEILQETLSHIQNLASKEGLRVMLMAGKELAMEEVTTFLETISQMEEGEQQPIVDSIEKEFLLHGATAMEDKLQEGVGECIDSLREAGISIWMLTGDKMETAVQIAHACHLVPSLHQDLIDISHLKGNSFSSVRDSLRIISEKYDELESNIFKCLVFEGRVLNFILDEQESTDLENVSTFLKLCKSVNACVSCRMTPKLKGKIVRLIKYPLSSEDSNNRLQSLSSPICLAIGDGGNDCNMILEADVGIGISSSAKIDQETHQEVNTESEHLQAVRAADFGIPRFSMLKRLLLVHGRNSYKRLALISQYTMYKSVVLAACQLVYNLLFTYFSGNTILQSHSLVFYNILYTSVVPFAFSMGDVRIGDLIRYITPASLKLGSANNGHSFEVSDMALEKIPELYRSSRRGETLTQTSLFLWFLNAAYQGFIIVLFTCFGIGYYGANILSRPQNFHENSLNIEISRFGKFKNDLEHINSLMIFIIVSVQYLTVMIMERCNHVKFHPGITQKPSPSLLNLRLSTVIMGLSICVFLIVNSMSFLGGNLGHLEGRLWRVFLVLGDYSLFYLVALIAISLCILPSLLVIWGVRDASFFLLLKNLKHLIGNGCSTYSTLSTSDSDEEESLDESDRLLLRYNVSAYIRQREEQFYSATDANSIDSEKLDQFYGKLRKLVRLSMGLSEL